MIFLSLNGRGKVRKLDKILKPYDTDREPVKAVEYFNTNYPAKHKFEIPYNADDNLIRRIGEHPVLKAYTKFIYLPCDPSHGMVNDPVDRPCNFGIERTKEIIALIQSYGMEPGILIQRNDNLEGMKFYVDLGVKYFTIGDDRLADKARDKWGNDVYLTSSVTHVRAYEDFFDLKPDLYNVIILHFWFNKHLEFIKYLPPQHHYGLIVNDMCWYNCPQSLTHWFPEIHLDAIGLEKLERGIKTCIKKRWTKDDLTNFDNVSYIFPVDLHYFENYISSYKVVDRMSPTNAILENYISYITATNTRKNQGIIRKKSDYDIDKFEPFPNVLTKMSQQIRDYEPEIRGY